MRVLHAHTGNLYGGIETLLATLARCRDLAPGLDQRFALCFEGRLARELREAGAPVRSIGPARYSRPWTILAARRAFRAIVAEERPEAIICHSAWPHATLATEARRAGVPLVYWQNDMVSPKLHWVERLAARMRPDLVLVNSRATAETTRRLFPGVPSEVIYYPVLAPPAPAGPEALRREVRRELETPDDVAVIAMTCRLQSYKGHTLLLDALCRLRDRPGWRAWIAGGVQRPHERDLLDALKRTAEAGGVIDRIRFVGERSDIARLLAAADIHCQPNLGPEPFGIVFVEALYAGLPVVTTAIGGAAEIVTDTCGILVPPADPAALADALAGLIADPARRKALGQGGPPRARQLCDPAASLSRLTEILGRLRLHPAAAGS